MKRMATRSNTIQMEQSLPARSYRVVVDGEAVLEATGTLFLDLYDLQRLLIHLGFEVELETEPLPLYRGE